MPRTIVLVDMRETQERFDLTNHFMPNSWSVKREMLEIGDYICGKVCVEWKKDDFLDVGHLHDQVRRMVRAFDPRDCHVICEHSLPRVLQMVKQRNDAARRAGKRPAMYPATIYGLIASINAMGVHIHFCSGKTHGFLLMRSLFEKGNDDKDRFSAPVRNVQLRANPYVQLYCAIDGIGEKMGRKIHERFPVPAKLFKTIAYLNKRPYKWFKENDLTWCKAALTRMSAVIYGRVEEEYGEDE